MRTLYNLPDGDVEDINKRVASQVLDDDQPNKSYLTISQVCPFLLFHHLFFFLLLIARSTMGLSGKQSKETR